MVLVQIMLLGVFVVLGFTYKSHNLSINSIWDAGCISGILVALFCDKYVY